MNMTIRRPRVLVRLLLGAACALAPLSHAAEISQCSFVPFGTLALYYSTPTLSIFSGGSINGRPAEMLISTSNYQTLLTPTGIAKHDLRLISTNSPAPGVANSVHVKSALVDQITVGPVSEESVKMAVLDRHGYAPTYDAIIGSRLLFKTDLEISLATKEIHFFKPGNCANALPDHWNGKTHTIPLKEHDKEDLGPRFIVRINGTDMEAVINTGADVSYITRRAAERAGVAFDTAVAERAPDFTRVDGHTGAHWFVNFKTFQIGGETVQNAEMTAVDVKRDTVDVTLGADFLRAYRVLFALSQKKLYFSHVGGKPFSQRRTLEPWMVLEAESGNADAQVLLGSAYESGDGVPRDPVHAAEWIERAAKGGSALANLYTGSEMVKRGDYAGAAPRLRIAINKLPVARDAAFLLYIARVRNGDAELAKSELAATFDRSGSDEWPKPIADFYLGKLSADELLAHAKNGDKDKLRYCEALSAMGDWHRTHGQQERARTLDAQLTAGCGDTGQTYTNIGG